MTSLLTTLAARGDRAAADAASGADLLGAVSVLCTGLLVGYLAMYFVSRLTGFTLRGLGALLAMLFTGVVISFLGTLGDADRANMAWYPIGLVLGVAVWIALRFVTRRGGGTGIGVDILDPAPPAEPTEPQRPEEPARRYGDEG